MLIYWVSSKASQLLFLAFLLVVSSCSSELDLNGRRCPCVDGWFCDEATQMCVLTGSSSTDSPNQSNETDASTSNTNEEEVPLCEVCEWKQIVELFASDAVASANFGFSVAASNELIVVGAPAQDSAKGAVYAFEKIGGAWTEVAKLTASDGANGDQLGYSVATDGTAIVAGALYDDGVGSDSGSAYVFERQSGTFAQVAKLSASDAVSGARFGGDVAFDDGTIVVAAPQDGNNRQGAAYVFDKNGDTWTQTTKLLPASLDSESYLGEAIALDGNLLLATAPGYVSDYGPRIYVFEFANDTWTESTAITRPSSLLSSPDYFGVDVDLRDGRAVAGVRPDDGTGLSTAFTREITGDWLTHPAVTTSDLTMNDDFGEIVATSGNEVFVSASGHQDDGDDLPTYGAVFVFELINDQWVTTDKLTAPQNSGDEGFATAVDVGGNVLVIGAYLDNTQATQAGSVYVFEPREVVP